MGGREDGGGWVGIKREAIADEDEEALPRPVMKPLLWEQGGARKLCKLHTCY